MTTDVCKVIIPATRHATTAANTPSARRDQAGVGYRRWTRSLARASYSPIPVDDGPASTQDANETRSAAKLSQI